MSRFTSSTFSLTGSVPGATSSTSSNASARRGRGYQVPQNSLVQSSSDLSLLPTRANTNSSLISTTSVQKSSGPSLSPRRARTASSLASQPSYQRIPARGSNACDNSIHANSTSGFSSSSSILESSYMCKPLRLLDTRGPTFGRWPSDSEDSSSSSIPEPSTLQPSRASSSIASSKSRKSKNTRFTPSTLSQSVDWSLQNRLGAGHLPNPNESVVTDEVEWLDTSCSITLYSASTEDWTYSSETPGESELFPVHSPCIRVDLPSEKKPSPVFYGNYMPPTCESVSSSFTARSAHNLSSSSTAHSAHNLSSSSTVRSAHTMTDPFISPTTAQPKTQHKRPTFLNRDDSIVSMPCEIPLPPLWPPKPSPMRPTAAWTQEHTIEHDAISSVSHSIHSFASLPSHCPSFTQGSSAIADCGSVSISDSTYSSSIRGAPAPNIPNTCDPFRRKGKSTLSETWNKLAREEELQAQRAKIVTPRPYFCEDTVLSSGSLGEVEQIPLEDPFTVIPERKPHPVPGYIRDRAKGRFKEVFANLITKPYPRRVQYPAPYVPVKRVVTASRFVDSRPTAARFQVQPATVPTPIPAPVLDEDTSFSSATEWTDSFLCPKIAGIRPIPTVIPTTVPVIPVPIVETPHVADFPVVESSDYDDDYTSDYPSSLDSYLPESQLVSVVDSSDYDADYTSDYSSSLDDCLSEPELGPEPQMIPAPAPAPRIPVAPRPTWYQKNRETIQRVGCMAIGAVLMLAPKLIWGF